MKEYYKQIIDYIIDEKPSKQKLSNFKIKLCKKYGMKKIPTDIQILLNATVCDLKKFKLVTKPTRTMSGVSVVAIMSKPQKCPHGKCAMCPTNLDDGIPMSYTGHEPATMRGLRNDFDSYLQVFNRLEQYVVLGQNFDKIELIIMGGTFPSFEKKYQEEFVTNALAAMNDFSEIFFSGDVFDVIKFREFFMLPHDVREKNEERARKLKEKIISLRDSKKRKLLDEQIKNETSNIRCVGMTVETRPDYGFKKHGIEMLKLGVTRVELGVQSVYDKALDAIDRGHSVKDSIKSIKELKDLGFKLNYHYMPGLPGISFEEDVKGFKMLFDNSDFRPDMLKIYPCMIMPGTKLFSLYEKGGFKPLSTKQAAKLIYEFKPFIPTYCRVMRIQRDIPTYKTVAGVSVTNLRQEVDKLKPKCNCIRCREIGQNREIKLGKVEIKVYEYSASKGKEFFISAEDFSNNVLIGFCRLRFVLESLIDSIGTDSGIIRELHVYGEALKIGSSGQGVQHKGYGKKLVKMAEKICKDHGKKKLLVISGIGVKEYYKKLGFSKDGYYMSKGL